MQIGKTSAVVLTLCGVLKDILLVIASMLIWDTQVSALQVLGYSIALGGIVYYKLGYDRVKGVVAEAGRNWADLGARRPIFRQIAVIGLSVFVILTLLSAFSPARYPHSVPNSSVFGRHRVATTS
jgi:hypothetical protein